MLINDMRGLLTFGHVVSHVAEQPSVGGLVELDQAERGLDRGPVQAEHVSIREQGPMVAGDDRVVQHGRRG